MHLGHAEGGVLVGDHQIARQHDLGATAQRRPVDGGDERLVDRVPNDAREATLRVQRIRAECTLPEPRHVVIPAVQWRWPGYRGSFRSAHCRFMACQVDAFVGLITTVLLPAADTVSVPWTVM